jgi:hypothetical protein
MKWIDSKYTWLDGVSTFKVTRDGSEVRISVPLVPSCQTALLPVDLSQPHSHLPTSYCPRSLSIRRLEPNFTP